MLSLILVFCRFVAIAVPPAQLSSETSAPDTPPTVQIQPPIPLTIPPAQEKLSDDEVKEIDRIRRQLSPLNGTLFDSENFADRLRADFGQPIRRETGSARNSNRSQSIQSIRRRLEIVADDLDAHGLRKAAQQARDLEKSLP